MIITLVVAATENNVIGKGGSIPWDLPRDMKHFKDVTMGKPIIMGRKTFESIGRPLPGRRNIVITRQSDYKADGIDVVSSLEESFALVHDTEEACVIGGGEIYRQSLEHASRIELTRVHCTIDGDAFFPELDSSWHEVQSEEHKADEKHAYDYTFVTYERS